MVETGGFGFARFPFTDSTAKCRLCRLHGLCPSRSTLAAGQRDQAVLATPAVLISSSAALSLAAPKHLAAEGTTGTGEESSFAGARSRKQAATTRAPACRPRRLPNRTRQSHRARGNHGPRLFGPTAERRRHRRLLASAPWAKSAGARIVALAESQLGQTEQPPGSNESAGDRPIPHSDRRRGPRSTVVRILRLLGSPSGRRAAGRPGAGEIGDVSDIWSWAQSAGRATSPTDRASCPSQAIWIVFGGEHVGIASGASCRTARSPRSRATTKTRSPPTYVAPPKPRGYVSMS